MALRCLAQLRTVGMLLLLVFVSIVAVGVESFTPAQNAPAHATAIVPQFAIEDFDGDKKPDIATVLEGRNGAAEHHYWITVQFSRGGSENIDVAAPAGGLDITTRDVNGDDFLDVIVTTAGTNRPVAVLLNDGAGNFTASDPSAFPGAFRKTNNFWSGLTEQLQEASPALFSRFFSNDLQSCKSTFSLPVEIGVFARRSNRLEAREADVSYLGRAPPILRILL